MATGTEPRARGARRVNALLRSGALALVVLLQGGAAAFFLWDVFGGVLGLRTSPLAWEVHEAIELAAAVGLLTGLALGAVILRRAVVRTRAAEARLRAASADFAALVEERFADWGLTPAERDVAWFSLKGLTIAEIAALRETSEGTVKAQSNAIYRKAGVGSRAQLLGLFIEDLLAPPAEALLPEGHSAPPPP